MRSRMISKGSAAPPGGLGSMAQRDWKNNKRGVVTLAMSGSLGKDGGGKPTLGWRRQTRQPERGALKAGACQVGTESSTRLTASSAGKLSAQARRKRGSAMPLPARMAAI